MTRSIENINYSEQEKSSETEFTNLFPEIYANPPLEDTSLVYSVPVKGEWHNGNLQKMMHAMFSQKATNRPFEVEIIANIGSGIHNLIDKDLGNGSFTIKSEIPEDANYYAKDCFESLKESREMIKFVKKIIEIQRLARAVALDKTDYKAQEDLSEAIKSIDDPLLKDIADLAVKNADNISLALVDATKTDFYDSVYKSANISTFRTIGADVASERFKNKDTVIGFFDADSVMEDNNSVENIQNIFESNPDLHYIFTGMAYLPPGYSKRFVSSSPKETVYRTAIYNESIMHGSPQIYFKLSDYETLKEISAWQSPGFTGHEDFDTARRLIYHFGDLQKGLLTESCIYAPTALTSDRIDGNMDSSVRNSEYKKCVDDLTPDLARLFSMKNIINEFIAKKDNSEKKKILKELEHSRKHYLKMQKIQQKMNKLVLKSFILASEKGFISLQGQELDLDEEKIIKMRGGKALLHYARANNSLVREVLSDPDDMKAIKYYLGLGEDRSDFEYSAFRATIREYVGKVEPLDDLISDEEISVGVNKKEGANKDKQEVEDLRSLDSDVSFLHSFVAETLALADIYRTYFEVDHFEEYFLADDSLWPEDRESKKYDFNFGDQKERREMVRSQLDKTNSDSKGSGYLNFKTIPIYNLFKKLLKVGRKKY